MFESSADQRKNVLRKIKSRYKTPCNGDEQESAKPDYDVRKTEKPKAENFNCPCCGSEMKPEQILEKSTVYRCTSCGMSDTRLNS